MKLAAALLLCAAPALAMPLQNDCRGPGSIGTALMSPDGVITLNVRRMPGAPLDGVVAVRPGDPQYRRVLSHLGGLSPGQKKPVPPFC